MRSYTPPQAKLVPRHAKQVFRGVIYEVYQWQQLMFDGSYQTFEMLKRPDTVKVLAVKDNQIIILDQEQPGYEAFYDLPGGRHDVDTETELQAAKREMLEETGMTFDSWKLIYVTQSFSKVEAFMYIYIATDFIAQAEQHLDPGEKIKILQLDLNEVKEILLSPETRYLPKELLEKVTSLEDLKHLPAIV
jgi:ADP-ribose pyrophosphatase